MPRIKERGVRPLAVFWLSGVASTGQVLVFGNEEDRPKEGGGQASCGGCPGRLRLPKVLLHRGKHAAATPDGTKLNKLSAGPNLGNALVVAVPDSVIVEQDARIGEEVFELQSKTLFEMGDVFFVYSVHCRH